jgi:CBS domain-containing protein
VLGHLRVRDVYIAEPPTVYGEMTIRQLDDKHKDRYNPEYVAVTKDGRSYLGIVTPSQMCKIRR